MKILITNDEQMKRLGEAIGAVLSGGELFELVGDVGAGKTTFTKGLARGLAITDDIQSPTFTINRTYAARDDLTLVHYDFYRLHDAGIMRDELQEVLDDPQCITVIEWSEIVEDVLPSERVRIELVAISENERNVALIIPKTEACKPLMDAVEKFV